MKLLINTFITFCIIVTCAFAGEYKVEVEYQKHFVMSTPDFLEQFGLSRVPELKCWGCSAKTSVNVYVFKNLSNGEKFWVWTADTKETWSYNQKSYTYNWTIKHDEYGQITYMSDHIGDYLINETVSERPIRKDPIDWKEIRRKTQESVDAHQNDK